MTTGELHDLLMERELAPGAQVFPKPAEDAPVPWYVQTLIAFCAWVAGVLLLVFLAVVTTSSGDHGQVPLFIGVGLCVTAGVLFATVAKRSLFANQLALALSFGGQIGVVLGLGEMGHTRAALWGTVVLEIVLAIAMQNHFQRFLSTLTAVVAWAFAMDELLLGDQPGGWIFSGRSTVIPATPDLLRSLSPWLIVWAPVVFATLWLVRHEADWMSQGWETYLRPVTHGAIAALAAAPLALLPSIFWVAVGLGHEAGLTSGRSPLIATWPLLGALLALLSLALAFALRHRPLMGLAAIFALLQISSFYYVLGASLLIKSVMMIALGVVLLAGARGLKAAWR